MDLTRIHITLLLLPNITIIPQPVPRKTRPHFRTHDQSVPHTPIIHPNPTDPQTHKPTRLKPMLRKLLLRPLPQLIRKLVILEYRLRILTPIPLWRIKSTTLNLALLRRTSPQLRLGTVGDTRQKGPADDGKHRAQHRSSCLQIVPYARVDNAGVQSDGGDVWIFLRAQLAEVVD